ncbi:hypothetical protein NLO72_07170 [Pseudomonas tremae]|uniref:hypothetical protein n=1 Tax=Pseudomonas tremae TaxID=200454 RepID=UPI00210E0B4F|nr:hypothetical protein [Pseudomonas tremae]MCQ2989018.1 hypothetical protein [Pseudomonas tremae]
MKIRTTPLERIAVGLATVLFIFGSILGYWGESVWLNRFGSLIIVVGVVMAAIKISDILNQQILQFMALNHEQRVEQVLDANRSFFKGHLPEGYEEKIRFAVEEKVLETFAEYKQKKVDRIKRVEIVVLVFGTLTNGFGDYLLGFIKTAAVCI